MKIITVEIMPKNTKSLWSIGNINLYNLFVKEQGSYATRAGRYWSFASRYIVQKYITILLFIAVIKDDCYIRVADCFIRVSRS